MNLFKILIYLGSASAIIPFITLTFRWNSTRTYNLYFFLYVVNNFASELVASPLALLHVRNLEVLGVFNAIEGILLLSMYQLSLVTNTLKKLLKILKPIYFLVFVLIYYYSDYKNESSSFAYAFHKSVMILPVILYLFERLQLMDELYITEIPIFWTSCGFLLFYGVSIFYFGLHDYLAHHVPDIDKKGWLIHTVLLITMNLFLTKAIWQIPKTQA